MDKTSTKIFQNFEGLDKFVEVYESTMIKNIRESKKVMIYSVKFL